MSELASESMSQGELALHGVVRAGHPLATDGFRLVTWEDLAAVVSEHAVSGPERLAHLEMLSGLVLDGPVVPLRAGTTAVDEDAVRTDVLAKSAAMLRDHLDRLEGLVEMHAYLRFDEDTAMRAVSDENQAEPRTGLALSDRVRLGEQVAHRVATWRRGRSAVLLTLVSALSRDEAALPDGEPTHERRAFLVPAHEIDAVRAAITGLSSAAVEAECVGPLPAYSFLAEPADAEPGAGPVSASRWGW